MSPSSFTPQLRPLSIGEMLDAGFRLLRARFGTLMLTILLVAIPVAILQTFVIASTDGAAFDLSAPVTPASDGVAIGRIAEQLLEGALAALAVLACFKTISAAYLGERAGVGASLRFAASRLLSVVGLYVLFVLGFIVAMAVLVGILEVVGVVILLPVLVFFGVRLAMALPVVAFERRGPFGGIGRSWELVRANWWRVFTAIAVTALIVIVASFALGAAFGATIAGFDTLSEAAVAVMTTVFNVILSAIVYPLWAAILTVVYYDLRVRKEGFDLQLLAERVGSEPSRFERPAPAPEPVGAGGFAPPEGSASPS